MHGLFEIIRHGDKLFKRYRFSLETNFYHAEFNIRFIMNIIDFHIAKVISFSI